ncbi:glycosyltransferase [Sessilibacter corallicola]|uniref:Glycosyltransferase n=1 Tax=Sessilibacter corallicola TaxID=2904075 RepID=A0ABQ0A744_9GAMM
MPNDLKIASVLAGANVGGAETFYTRFSCRLHQRDAADVRVFTRKNELREAEFSKYNVNTEFFRFGGKLHFLDHLRYQKALKKFDPSVVITFMNRATQLTPASQRYKLVGRLGHYYDYKYYRHCDHWVGITKGICDHLIRGGMPAKNIVHIPNFVDESDCEAIDRSSFSTPPDEPIILGLGRLHVNKAFDTLLPAFAKLATGTLWIAGEGPERENLTAQAESLGILDRVRFLGWRTDVNSLLKAADLFVCSSRSEGLGSILLEAWYNGCPMVSAKSEGPSELISHGETGLLCEIDDVDVMSQHMKTVLEDNQLAESLIANGTKEYQTKYSEKIVIDRYLEFFNEIA